MEGTIMIFKDTKKRLCELADTIEESVNDDLLIVTDALEALRDICAQLRIIDDAEDLEMLVARLGQFDRSPDFTMGDETVDYDDFYQAITSLAQKTGLDSILYDLGEYQAIALQAKEQHKDAHPKRKVQKRDFIGRWLGPGPDGKKSSRTIK